MRPEHEIFDDQLKSILGGFEGSVSSDNWDAILSKMDAPAKRRVAFYWYWVAGLVFLAIGSALVYFNWDRHAANQQNEPIRTEQSGIVAQEESSDEPVVTDFDASVDPNKIQSEVSDATTRVPERVSEIPVTHRQPNEIIGSNYTGTKRSTDVISVQMKGVELLLPLSNLAIFDASEIDAHELKYIPTINNGERKNSKRTLGMGTWEFGFSASPALASKLVKSNGSFGWLVNKDYQDITNQFESQGLSYHLAFNLNRYLTDRIYLSTGLTYAQLGEAISYDYIIDEFIYADHNFRKIRYEEIPDPRVWEHVQYNGHNTYHFVQIPVKIGIVVPVPNNRYSVRSEFGMQYARYVGGSGMKADVTYLTLEDISNSGEFAPNNFGLSANLGLYRSFKNNVEFGVVPFYQRNLTSIRKADNPITERPYNYGMNFQLAWKIRPSIR